MNTISDYDNELRREYLPLVLVSNTFNFTIYHSTTRQREILPLQYTQINFYPHHDRTRLSIPNIINPDLINIISQIERGERKVIEHTEKKKEGKGEKIYLNNPLRKMSFYDSPDPHRRTPLPPQPIGTTTKTIWASTVPPTPSPTTPTPSSPAAPPFSPLLTSSSSALPFLLLLIPLLLLLLFLPPLLRPARPLPHARPLLAGLLAAGLAYYVRVDEARTLRGLESVVVVARALELTMWSVVGEAAEARWGVLGRIVGGWFRKKKEKEHRIKGG
ncbi:hypothetical protein F5X96DRAFT_687924 [Biscogniauxia mediterranea]|nr:hypothetical protein F5X96DRAFT_687924 [Biscogniauxia mediterranea]